MAQPEHAIARERAAEHRAAFRPSLRVFTFEEPLRHPPEVPRERQIDVDERVRESEALPGGLAVAEAFDDPRVLPQDLRVGLEVLLVRNLAAAVPETATFFTRARRTARRR
jgi:hypothetical protein